MSSAAHGESMAVWLMEQLLGEDDPDVRNVAQLIYGYMQKTWRPELARDVVNTLMGLPGPRASVLRFVDGPVLDHNPQIRKRASPLAGASYRTLVTYGGLAMRQPVTGVYRFGS